MSPANEFYGDMFRIERWNVVIFGFGKSNAGRIASEWRPADELVTDHLKLRRDGAVLLAKLDLACFGPNDPRPRWHRVDAFARCLREDETRSVFGDRRLQIMPVGQDEFVRASRWNIGFPLDAENIDVRLAKRIPLFTSLVEGAVNHFCLVPWMDTVEMKGELLRAHRGALGTHAEMRLAEMAPSPPTKAPSRAERLCQLGERARRQRSSWPSRRSGRRDPRRLSLSSCLSRLALV